MLNLRRADAKSQGTKSPVRCGVAVAAHYRRTGQGKALLWTDDVHDALAFITQAIVC